MQESTPNVRVVGIPGYLIECRLESLACQEPRYHIFDIPCPFVMPSRNCWRASSKQAIDGEHYESRIWRTKAVPGEAQKAPV